MEEVLRHYIRTHGFRAVQETLSALAIEYRAFYEGELAFLSGGVPPPHPPSYLLPNTGHAHQVPPTPQPTPLIAPILNEFIEEAAPEPVEEIKVVQITERAAAKAEEIMDAKEFTLDPPAAPEGKKNKMKIIRKGNRVIPVPQLTADLVFEEVVEPAQPAQQAQSAQPLIVYDESHQQEPQQQEQPQKRTAAEIKKWQREQEAARKAYMKANKISRASLMTVANMRKWLGEGDTYAKIAREQLGCKEEEVSKFAKEHGLQRTRK